MIRSISPDSPADLAAYVACQHHAWGQDGVSEEIARERFRIFPEGIFLAVTESGEVVGTSTTILLTGYDLVRPKSWAESTANGTCRTHDDEGTVQFGVSLSARGHPDMVEPLLAAQLELARRKNVKFSVLGGRMPGYAKYLESHPGTTPDEYLGPLPDGTYRDWQVQMYADRLPGARILGAIPHYFKDPPSLDHGVLICIPNPHHQPPGR